MPPNNNNTNSNTTTTTRPLPSSPFWKPHLPSPVLVQQTVSTPHGRHHRTLHVLETPSAEHKSGLWGCAANMCTCIVGSGIVGLPYAMLQSGFVAGLVLVILCAALTEKSLRLLVETAKHLQMQSYETVAEVPFGSAGFRFILLNMFVMAYGAMITYLMITKTCAALLLNVQEENMKQYLLLGISLTIQLPLACMRDMADLEKTSGLAVAMDCAIVALVAATAPWETMQGLKQSTFTQLIQHDVVHWDTLFVGLGVLSFAFECQEAAFLVAGSLEKPTVTRWAQVTKRTLTACVVLAMVCAVTGYLGYGPETKGNILTNLPPDGVTTLVAHSMLGLTMFATYPLAAFVARHVCIVLLFEGPRAHQGGEDSTILNRADRRIGLTTALYMLALIPATIYTDMGKVLALAGVIGGSCLAYIGPGMLYLAVHGGRFLELQEELFYAADTTHPSTSGDQDVVSESTALVNRTSNENLQRPIDGCFKTCLYYMTGMPLWCKIAEIGKQRVLEHAQQMAQKNAMERLRIGDVDHSVFERMVERGENRTKKNQTGPPAYPKAPFMVRSLSDERRASNSGTLLAPLVTADPGALERSPKTLPPVPSLEPDPQEKPPTWLDFFIAIFYICFGILALVAGLVSLSASDEEDKSRHKTFAMSLHE